MCGIAGFVGSGDIGDLGRMLAALEHRGPDGEGRWQDPDEPAYLGHRRLAVVDLETGAQPMWTPDGRLGVVFNGEIYNHRELRADLERRGHRFVTDHADTEVLLHGTREWGEALLPRLEGMWAFALWNRSRRSLFLARDRFGQKPLFWTRRPGLFAFASELRALLEHSQVPFERDPEALRKYFGYGYVPAPRSLARGVFKLSAGTHLSVERDATPRLSRWWEFRLEPEIPAGEGAEQRCAEELRERLDRAVARRLQADVPVGVLLSGGIDSSAVVAAAARHAKPGELRTFSIGFEEASFDESGHAERVARAVGAVHRSSVFSSSRAREAWPELVARLDEPLADPSLLPTWWLCGQARRDVTVALGGDGADELFAGYDPFRALRWASLYSRWVPGWLHTGVRLLAARLPTSQAYMSSSFRVNRALSGMAWAPQYWNPLWLSPLEPGEIAELLDEPVDPEELYSEAIDAWDASPELSTVDRTLQFYTRLYLEGDILVKADRASMLHGLELRSPFLDTGVVDLARKLPADWKLRGGETKWILKRAVAPWLPAEVVARPKQGFGVPVGRWFADRSEPFDADAEAPLHARKLAEHRRGRADHRLYLYAQWLLDRWSPTGAIA